VPAVLALVALLLATGLAACSTSTGEGSPLGSSGGSGAKSGATVVGEDMQPYTGNDFYVPPDPLPSGAHGALIRYQPIAAPKVRGAQPYRILYLSESVAGKPIAVSGTALVPKAAPPKGGRGLVTIAHGTTGIADECAPSKSPARTELSLTTPMIRNGFLVAMSDYEGLGTPGRHPYLVGESEGRGVLDAITAAGQLPNASPGKRLGIAGYSQGGHGSLWAEQLAPTWTPQYKVMGTFAGAPASEISLVMRAAPKVAGFAFYLIAGIAAAYPDAKPAQVLTPLGVSHLTEVDRGCVRQVLPKLAALGGSKLVKPDLTGIEPWARLAKESDAGQVRTPDPLLIIQSKADNTVPIIFSEILMKRMCAEGQVVERRVRLLGENHSQAAVPAYQQAYEWMLSRFGIGNVPIKDDCPAG
jgi:hypothetical protein